MVNEQGQRDNCQIDYGLKLAETFKNFLNKVVDHTNTVTINKFEELNKRMDEFNNCLDKLNNSLIEINIRMAEINEHLEIIKNQTNNISLIGLEDTKITDGNNPGNNPDNLSDIFGSSCTNTIEDQLNGSKLSEPVNNGSQLNSNDKVIDNSKYQLTSPASKNKHPAYDERSMR